MFRPIALTSLLLSSLAAAAPRSAVLAQGDCGDNDLATQARALAAQITKQPAAPELIADEKVRERIGPPESSSQEELKLRLSTAQTHFYNGALAKADEGLEKLIQDIGQLGPGLERAELTASARLLRAMTLRGLNRLPEADEELRAILRLQPDYALNPEAYAPTVRSRFDRLRKDLAQASKTRLTVTSEPSGATVFLDGVAVGHTPLSKSLPPATYSLILERAGKTSFPRTVDVRKDARVRVDMAFETSLDTRSFACMTETPGEDRVGNALKLAILLELDELVLVRLERPSTGTRWLAASVLNVQTAQRIREAGIKLEKGPSDSAVDELARFLVTGIRTERIQQVPNLSPQLSDVPFQSSGTVGRLEAPVVRTWKTPAGIAAVSVGGGAAIAGVILAVSSAQATNTYNAYYENGNAPLPEQLPAVVDLRERARSHRTWSFVAFGAAAAAGTAGILLMVLDRGAPPPPDCVAVKLDVGPGSLGLAGSF